jgi:hypothetical protein
MMRLGPVPSLRDVWLARYGRRVDRRPENSLAAATMGHALLGAHDAGSRETVRAQEPGVQLRMLDVEPSMALGAVALHGPSGREKPPD